MIFCTAVSPSHIPHARVLAESLALHHPGSRLRVLVLDTAEEPDPLPEPCTNVPLNTLGLPNEELHRRFTMYDVPALSSSLRGKLIAACLGLAGGPVLYLDADMLVLGSLNDIEVLAEHHGIVLTPHCCVPLRFRPGSWGPEQAFLQAGVFNGGCLAVSSAAMQFLTWRDERAARDCVIEPQRELYLAQNWLALVPALFDSFVLRDRGVNLMAHGMGDDDLTWCDGRPSISGTPVRLFHFGGAFDPYAEEIIASRVDSWSPRAESRPGLARLYRSYAQRLLAAGYGARDTRPKRSLDPDARAAYREALIRSERDGTAEPPNPFTHGEAEFAAWCASIGCGPR
jgi:hypothetical protein